MISLCMFLCHAHESIDIVRHITSLSHPAPIMVVRIKKRPAPDIYGSQKGKPLNRYPYFSPYNWELL